MALPTTSDDRHTYTPSHSPRNEIIEWKKQKAQIDALQVLYAQLVVLNCNQVGPRSWEFYRGEGYDRGVRFEGLD